MCSSEHINVLVSISMSFDLAKYTMKEGEGVRSRSIARGGGVCGMFYNNIKIRESFDKTFCIIAVLLFLIPYVRL